MNVQQRRVSRTVWALGIVSLLMDASSETIHALLPLFITGTLGASVAVVGLIDGVAEATAAVVKVYSGYLSDRSGRRKPLILIGYGLGALAKPLFPLASGALLVLGARFVDRVGKGLRGAPRDALIADVTPPELRGRAYGLRQALDTTGAFIGPLLAIGLMWLVHDDIRQVFWFAAIPAFLAVLCVQFLVVDSTPSEALKTTARKTTAPIRLRDLGALAGPYWRVVALGVVFTFARFSEGFLILKATAEGLPLALAPLVLVVMNVVYAVAAYPAGVVADAFGTRGLLFGGIGALVVADLVLAQLPGLPATFAGIALWGLHMALTQGVFAKLVAGHAPEALRGSAFGMFNLASGVALLGASVIAGCLWDRWGAGAAFLGGAGFALAAAALLVVEPFERRAAS